MQRLRRKTSDKATERLVVAAAKQGVDLNWDRYEQQVPMCGFGRLGVCCTACTQGPCRVSPFDEAGKGTVCGRDRENIAASVFLRLIAEGGVAHASYVQDLLGPQADKVLGTSRFPEWLKAEGTALESLGAAPGSLPAEIFEAIRRASEGDVGDEAAYRSALKVGLSGFLALDAGLELGDALNGSPQVQTVEVNLGALKPDRINVLLHGSLSPQVISVLTGGSAGEKVNFVGMCGGEALAPAGVSLLSNYGAQEAVLLSGLIDAVIVGKQCVTPGFKAAAAELGVPLFPEAAVVETDDEGDCGLPPEIAAAAEKHYSARQHRKPRFEFPEVKATVGFDLKTFEAVSHQAWQKLFQETGIPGLALVGGCNNAKETQDKVIVRRAQDLLAQGYLVVATGCAAAGLAKAGLLDPAGAQEYPAVSSFLEKLAGEAGTGSLPPVFHFGTCWETPRALRFMKALEKAAGASLGLVAVFPEIARPAAWATALALPSLGVVTTVGPVMPSGDPEGALTAVQAVLGREGLLRMTQEEVAAAR